MSYACPTTRRSFVVNYFIMNISSYNIKIPMRRFEMEGKLGVPEMPKALVIFSSEHRCNLFNYQNDFIAKTLHKNKIATLSVDLWQV